MNPPESAQDQGIMLHYTVHDPVTLDEFRDVLRRSTLAARRPVGDEDCLRSMLQHANLVVTCRQEGRLVGVARSVTDFSYCCYLSDLAVDEACQRQGIGRQLIQLTRGALAPACRLILLAAPAAVDYYPRLGFERHPECWTLPGSAALRP